MKSVNLVIFEINEDNLMEYVYPFYEEKWVSMII